MPTRLSFKAAEIQPQASDLTRTVLGIISIGGGIVTVGIATSLPLPATAALLLAAGLQIAYGVVVTRGLHVREWGSAVLLLPSLIFGFVLALGSASFGSNLMLAFGLGAALNVLGALAVIVATRARWASRKPRRSWTFLLAAALAAVAVGSIATSALAATSAGEHAAAHGGMAGMGMSR